MKTKILTASLQTIHARRGALVAVVVTAALAGQLASAQTPGNWATISTHQEIPGLISKGGKIAVRPDDGAIVNLGTVWLDSGGPVNGSFGAAVRVSTDQGQNWQTQSFYSEPGWRQTEYSAFVFDPAGCLITAGETWDPNPHNHKNWFVQRICAGPSFSLIDSYSNQEEEAAGHCPSAQDIAFSANGDLYVAGFARGFDEPFLWAVRKSSDGGATWQTVNLEGAGDSNGAFAIACHPEGNVFVGGVTSYISRRMSIQRWTVKRSVNQGAGWTTVDSLPDQSAVTASTVDHDGHIYFAGWAKSLGKKNVTITDWMVRRSADNGITWTVSDKFALSTGHNLTPLAMTVDPTGNIWVCGHTENNDGIVPMRWIVRKGTRAANGTLTWAEVDNYQLAPGQHARANGITSDDAGNIYVSGRATDSNGSTFWIVRKLNAN